MSEAAALGFRAHSGWRAVVAVPGSPGRAVVLERRRIETADTGWNLLLPEHYDLISVALAFGPADRRQNPQRPDSKGTVNHQDEEDR
jgi:hypothetical protein